MVARNRVVISGPIGSPAVERWSVSLHFALADGGAISGVPALSAWAVGIATVLDAGETDYPIMTASMSQVVQADRVDVYEYGASGPAIAQAGATYSWSGTGSSYKPLSTATVYTLNTSVAGRSFRGRAYWPGVGINIQATGKWGVSAGTAAEFAEMLTDIEAAAPDPLIQSVVYSPTRNLVTPVTSIRVGDAPDTQRRRDDGIAETYQTAPKS